MNIGTISKRYAKALLQYAIDNKAEDTVYSEMKTLAKTFVDVPQLRMAMDNPMLTTKDKLPLIKAAIGNEVSEITSRFLNLVLKNKRETILQFIASSYCGTYCDMKHINTGKLITAAPVDKKVVDKIKQLVQKIKPGVLDFQTEVNPEIDGGFMLFFDTYRIDASVRSQLKRIKKRFIEENSKMA